MANFAEQGFRIRNGWHSSYLSASLSPRLASLRSLFSHIVLHLRSTSLKREYLSLDCTLHVAFFAGCETPKSKVCFPSGKDAVVRQTFTKEMGEEIFCCQLADAGAGAVIAYCWRCLNCGKQTSIFLFRQEMRRMMSF